MELFFAPGPGDSPGRPFLLDSLMRWPIAVNHFLRDIAMIDGKTASLHTWRAYAYHLRDFLTYCEKIGLDWSQILEIHLAEYRNELFTAPSQLTKNRLKRETVNGRLVTVCLFFKFALKKGYVSQLPFTYKDVSVTRKQDDDMLAHLSGGRVTVSVNRLMLRTYKEDLELSTNKEIGRFLDSFTSWRDKLIGETMWFTGLRREEACNLTIHALPEDPFSLTGKTHKVRIKGKGGKWRSVYFPVALLRSIARYIEFERAPRVRKNKAKTDRIWVSDEGRPIRPATIDKAFATNSTRCGVKVIPHDLRRSYATNRLIFLEDREIPSPYKIVQMELGHAHLSTTMKYIRFVERMRAEVVASHGEFIDQLNSNLGGSNEKEK